MNTTDVRIAIVGCGAVTEQFYLPVLRQLRDVRATLLIDIDAKRLEYLAAKFGINRARVDFNDCYDLFDAAVVALPHTLHADTCVKLLEHRKAVLVEKPMAVSVAECDAMIDAARQNGTLLAVGLMRRFLRSHRLTSVLIKSELLGQIESFDFREGSIYNWPISSDSAFRKETAGGGVLVDIGAHVLDCLMHWLGDFAEVEYFDDAEGGVDANCLLKLRLKNGINGVVELSRTRKLRNTAIIRGKRGVLETALDRNRLDLSIPGEPYTFEGSAKSFQEPYAGREDQGYADLFRAQLVDFIAAIRNNREPYVDGQSVRSSIRLIETCYQQRKPLQLPWMRQSLNVNG